MRIGIVTLAAGVVLLSTSLSADAAIETKTTAVEPVTNPSLRSGTRWTEKSKVNDADGLDFSNVEDTDSSDEELSPSAKVVENEEDSCQTFRVNGFVLGEGILQNVPACQASGRRHQARPASPASFCRCWRRFGKIAH